MINKRNQPKQKIWSNKGAVSIVSTWSSARHFMFKLFISQNTCIVLLFPSYICWHWSYLESWKVKDEFEHKSYWIRASSKLSENYSVKCILLKKGRGEVEQNKMYVTFFKRKRKEEKRWPVVFISSSNMENTSISNLVKHVALLENGYPDFEPRNHINIIQRSWTIGEITSRLNIVWVGLLFPLNTSKVTAVFCC